MDIYSKQTQMYYITSSVEKPDEASSVWTSDESLNVNEL